MLTRLRIRNFKRLEAVDIQLDDAVVLIGPNNSGKTTLLQALTLWAVGVSAWRAKRSDTDSPSKRPGVPINRRDLTALPVPSADQLWQAVKTRRRKESGGKGSDNILIEIMIEGVDAIGNAWTCGLEFDYANAESFYCRPLRLNAQKDSERMPVPNEAGDVRIALLPAMSGLTSVEPVLQTGRINVLIGEGQTAQVLRNLCYQLSQNNPEKWLELRTNVKAYFGADLDDPENVEERGEIRMSYRETDGKTRLDLTASGRGMQQMILLLAHLYSNPNSVLLLDEPDAHLEILRQRQMFKLIRHIATTEKSQLIVASHSEVILDEAVNQQTTGIIAFIGNPHLITDKKELLKSLRDIPFHDYMLADQRGWVLYVEGSTDLSILSALAARLEHHRAEDILRDPFVFYLESNNPSDAENHFNGLREAKPDLIGFVLFDRTAPQKLQGSHGLVKIAWRRREIENYIVSEEVLLAYSRADSTGDEPLWLTAREDAMRSAIEEVQEALKITKSPKFDLWSPDTKISEDGLPAIFRAYAKKLHQQGLPAKALEKGDFYRLIDHLDPSAIDDEVTDVLNQIVAVADRATTN